MRHGGGAKRSLPLTPDAHHGTVGSARLHPHPAQDAGHEEAPLPVPQKSVSSKPTSRMTKIAKAEIPKAGIP